MSPRMGDYRHRGATRKNNPPAKIAAEGTVPVIPKVQYAYNAHLPPVLRFNAQPLPTGDSGPDGFPSDVLPELVAKARREPLTEDEARLLADALRMHEPWLEWTGKHEQQRRGGFEVDPVALHIHERISTQAILKVAARQDVQRSLFADPQQEYHEAVQFYRHDVDWANRLILGDSLAVMSSLARREDLAGKVQLVYLDPPYGIKFASNFQPEVGRRDVKDKEQDLTREPEMVRAYRDTWHLGIHSYLSYLRDRLIVARELLADTGSIFVQINDENLARVRQVIEEVFGVANFVSLIAFKKTVGLGSSGLTGTLDYLLWFARSRDRMTFHQLYGPRQVAEGTGYVWFESTAGECRRMDADEQEDSTRWPNGVRAFCAAPMMSSGYTVTCTYPFEFEGETVPATKYSWKTNADGMRRLIAADRVIRPSVLPNYKMFSDDYPAEPLTNHWDDVRASDLRYVVQTANKVVQRCMLMTTDPGDLVLDPTCGSGTTAYVAEQWGRRWITIDTSRVAIAIARQRLLTAKYDYYKTRHEGTEARSHEGNGSNPASGFAYKTVPHITLKSIAQNTNLDPIFAKHEPALDAALAACNKALKNVTPALRERLEQKLRAKERNEGKKSITDADRRRWLLPPANREDARREHAAAVKRGASSRYTVDLDVPTWNHWEVPFDTDDEWPKDLQEAVTAYRARWRAKLDEVNACIAANAEQEELVDQPEIVRGITRVSGPFTVEAVQPPEMTLGDNIDEYTSAAAHGGGTPTPQPTPVEGEGAREGVAGAPGELPEGFEARAIRMVEPRPDLEARNVEAYLDKMLRLLKIDGVRFPNNKQMAFSRLEPLWQSGTSGMIHAEGRWMVQGNADDDAEGRAFVAVSFGPQYGPVTAKMVEECNRSANRADYKELVVAAFGFDGPSQAVIDEVSGKPQGRKLLNIHAALICPDVNPGMEGLLKERPGSQLFTVFGQPRTTLDGPDTDGMYTVTMEGVDIYDPVQNLTISSGAEKVAAWFLDSDYDGWTFCITQAFFPDRSAWDKLARALNGKDGPIDSERFEALSGTVSLPFAPGKHRCAAVKVIDPRGNEVMKVHRLG